MKTYAFLELRVDDTLTVYCADEILINFVEEEARKMVPSCRIKDKGTWFIRVDKLKDKTEELKHNLINKFGIVGWEPFSVFVPSQTPHGEVRYYYFRKESENK